jgi:phosphatidylglycerol:prolipoprotein diacylglycerol transferase
MISELFRIGPISVSPFGVMLVVAFLGAFLQLRWGARRLRLGGEDDWSAMLLAAAVGGLVGGKIYYALLYGDWRLVFDRAGIVFYGSLLGGTLAVAWVVRRRRLSMWRAADAVAPAVAIGYALGRVGCLLVGDDYGVPTELPWGMTFPEGPIPTTAADLENHFGVAVPPGYAPDDQVPVHPTQIYETLAAGVIWLLGRRGITRGAPSGAVGAATFSLLALERFLVEFLRAKDDRFLGVLTVAQAISLALVVGIGLLWLLARPREAEPVAART